MSTIRYRKVTVDLKAARRAVNAGLASWAFLKPARVEPAAFPVGRPVAPSRVPFRRPFGQGLGERCPVYRSEVSAADLAWREAETAQWEADDFDWRAGVAEAMDRMESGLLF